MALRQLRTDGGHLVQNRREMKENSYTLAFEGSLYSGDLYWGYKLAFSVCLSLPPSLPPSLPLSHVCLSRFLDSGVETVRGISTKFSGWIDPPGGCVLFYFSRLCDARGTWHVPPRKGLYKFVRASTSQMRDTADSKLACHAYTTPTFVLLWLPFLWGAGCTRQGRKTF